MQARNEKEKAQGFINLVLTDSNGNRHNFKMGIPLYSSRKIDSKLLDNPNLIEDLEPSQIELKVHVVQDEVEPEF